MRKQLQHARIPVTFALSAALAAVTMAAALTATFAFADTVAPHVATTTDTDSCAMCHRAHSAFALTTWTDNSATPTKHTALAAGGDAKSLEDVNLCYACHGVGSLGSTHDIESEFDSGPGHSLSPTSSAYGPSPKQCSDCHDSHGSERAPGGGPVPALLRVKTSAETFVYSGDAYCTACHAVRPGNEFPGLSVWQKTAHASIATPTSGTGIVCDTCHTPHASSIAPNIVSQIGSPALSATVAVTANDRTFCTTCHAASERTWDGTATYQTSGHGSSAATVPVSGEWAAAGASRQVGECQVCHDPMGVSDGSGGAIPRLAVKSGSALCYTCHDASGPAASNLASMAFVPTRGVTSLVAAYGAPAMSQFGRVHVYTRLAPSSSSLIGPREYQKDGRVGAVAAADINADGTSELLVAKTGASVITVLANSPFSGLVGAPGDVSVLAPADFLGAGNVLDYSSGPPQVVTASGHTVLVYTWNAANLTLDPVTSCSVPSTQTITGLAVGKVLGAAHDDVVVTTDADQLVVMTTTANSLGVSGTYATRHSPVGPSIGDIDHDGHGEIAVANSGETSPTLSVFSATGAEIWSGGSTTDATPTATAIGDFLPGVTVGGTSGDEIALAVAKPTGTASVEVFAVSGSNGHLDAPQTHDFADRSNPSALATGDVDGTGRTELIVGLSGLFSADPAEATPPAVAIVRATPDGTAIGTVEQHSGGGVELAGATNVLAADLGPIGPSRHPYETATGAHVSTETAHMPEHVACVDCHNVHVASNAATDAPKVPGPLAGTWGVSVTNNSATDITITDKQGVADEYQLCLKCHSTWGSLTGVRSVAPEFNTKAQSFHPVEGPSPSTNAVGATMEGSLHSGSIIYCTDCHGNSVASEPKGPHRSLAAPLLSSPLIGTQAADTTSLCYTCHRWDIYGPSGSADGSGGTRSGFYDATQHGLHSFHTTRQVSCEACHVSHGSSDEPYLLRGDIGWSASTGDGSCANACHTGGARRSYTRP